MGAVLAVPAAGSGHADLVRGAAPRKVGPFRLILWAIMEARQRKADREIAEILSRRGGVMAEVPPFRGLFPGTVGLSGTASAYETLGRNAAGFPQVKA
jgi:hypothetical protein